MKLRIILCVLLGVLTAQAQTNAPVPVTQTNVATNKPTLKKVNGVTIEQVYAGLNTLSNEVVALRKEYAVLSSQKDKANETLTLQHQAGQITQAQLNDLAQKNEEVFGQKIAAINQQIASIRLQELNIRQRYNIPEEKTGQKK